MTIPGVPENQEPKIEVNISDTEPEIEPVDITQDPNFNFDLFTAEPTFKESEHESIETQDKSIRICPFYPTSCDKVDTSRCDKTCKHNPDNFITNPHIKEVFDKEPWSNYCFTCEEFVPSRNHEAALDPPALVGSHLVATGFAEYRIKLSKWVLERVTGRDHL